MTTYTTAPYTLAPDTHTTIFENGQMLASVPHDRVLDYIARHKRVMQEHWSAIAARTDDRLVIAKGIAYSIGSPSDNPRGFGGSVWRIRFFDGRDIVCNSLWCLGDIPNDRRDQLPDNATLKEIGYEPRQHALHFPK